eukprot:jgi/Chlat1/8967/Chrsp94S08261
MGSRRWPTLVQLHKAKKMLEVHFDNGRSFNLPAELLRVESPSALNRRVVSGRRHVGIMGVESVGNYGVRLMFDDLHDTGIYTWDFIYNLGDNKFGRIRQYLCSLKRAGLSRDSLKPTKQRPDTTRPT